MAEKVIHRLLTHTSRTLQTIPRNITRTVVTHTAQLEEVKGVALPKPVTDLPGPTGMPVVGTLPHYFRKRNRGKMHEVQRSFHKKFGKMFKERLGPHLNISIADPEILEELMRKEGKHPHRPPYESWILYKKLRDLPGGLMTSTGEDWQNYRSIISQKILKPKHLAEFVGVMNGVLDSFMDRLDYVLEEGDGHTVSDLPFECGKWALENTAVVLLDARVGCLENDIPPKIQEFITAIGDMFRTGHQLMVFANVHQALNTSTWRTHVNSWDTIYSVAREYVDAKIDEVKGRLDAGQEVGGEQRVDFLTYLLTNDRFPQNEVYSNLIEILLSGVDTASNTLIFALYMLAKHPHNQERLRKEISNVVGSDVCTSEHLQRLPYLKACIKETLRLYPVIPINARVMTEDTEVNGHMIPKDTCILFNTYTMGRDPEHFEDPDSFKPERWLRGDERENFNPFAAVPFGFGARSCIGRRIAEQKLYLATTRFMQRFELKIDPNYELQPVLRTLLTPGKDIPLKFVKR